MRRPEPHERPLLTVSEVAHRFSVDQRTLFRWVEEGLVTEHKTLLGQRRFREDEIRAALTRDEKQVQAECEGWRLVTSAYVRQVELLDWLIDLDRPGSEARKTVTLDLIIRRARYARSGDEEELRGVTK